MVVSFKGHLVAHSPVEQLAEGVLQQWQRRRLTVGLGGQASGETRLEFDTDPASGLDDGAFELIGSERGGGNGRIAEDARERRVFERAVVVVGTQGDDEAER